MKSYNGFAALLVELGSLPRTGWIFVSNDLDRTSKEALRSAMYMVADDKEEGISLERSQRTLMECPTLVDVVDVLNKRSVTPGLDEYIEAALYYRENDDFLE